MARYVFSDLHGQLTLWRAIKNFVKPEDKLYCLGDCGDRGPQPWETIKEVINDPQVVYLKGNHEDMLVAAMAEYLDHPAARKFHQKYRAHSFQQLLAQNGGSGTLQGWIDEGADYTWIQRLDNLPTLITLDTGKLKLALCHAGYSPMADDEIPDDFELLWDRGHLTNPWVPGTDDNLIIIHGHTPCPYLAKKWTPEHGAIIYADGHKIDIDVGSVWTNMACLLDLDTFDEHYFAYDPNEQG